MGIEFDIVLFFFGSLLLIGCLVGKVRRGKVLRLNEFENSLILFLLALPSDQWKGHSTRITVENVN